jgi:hypothetical protein
VNRTCLMLGKQPAVRDGRNLLIKNYLPAVDVLTEPLMSKSWTSLVPDPRMFGNDKWGDCVFAMVAHAIQTLSAALGLEVVVDTQAVVDEYLAYTGGRDTGAVVLDVLKRLCKRGLFGRKPALGFAELNLQDHKLLAQCVDIFGGVLVGVGLPVSAQGQLVWDVDDGPDGVPWSWGGHGLFGGSHAPQKVLFDSWAERIPATLPFVDKYADEGYVVILEEFLDSDRVSASGLKVDALIEDLELVRAA